MCMGVQDVRCVAGGDGVGARAESDGGRAGVWRLAVGGHRLVLHGDGADGESRAAGGNGGRGALRVRQRPALGPAPVGPLPRLRARRLTGTVIP